MLWNSPFRLLPAYWEAVKKMRQNGGNLRWMRSALFFCVQNRGDFVWFWTYSNMALLFTYRKGTLMCLDVQESFWACSMWHYGFFREMFSEFCCRWLFQPPRAGCGRGLLGRRSLDWTGSGKNSTARSGEEVCAVSGIMSLGNTMHIKLDCSRGVRVTVQCLWLL